MLTHQLLRLLRFTLRQGRGKISLGRKTAVDVGEELVRGSRRYYQMDVTFMAVRFPLHFFILFSSPVLFFARLRFSLRRLSRITHRRNAEREMSQGNCYVRRDRETFLRELRILCVYVMGTCIGANRVADLILVTCNFFGN